MRGIFAIFLTAATAVAALPSTASNALVPAAPEFQTTPTGTDGAARPAATPPTILFYPGRDCLTGGFRLSITDRMFNTCLLSTPPTFGSVKIDNPDRTFLPYIFRISFVGNTCPTGLADIPATNTCYNINPSGGNGWYISTSGGGTF